MIESANRVGGSCNCIGLQNQNDILLQTNCGDTTKQKAGEGPTDAAERVPSSTLLLAGDLVVLLGVALLTLLLFFQGEGEEGRG
jgi:hypothetical protein